MDSNFFNKPFEELMVLLQDKNVISETRTFLERNGAEISVRKFLSFFMIFYHKNELLDESDISLELFKQVKRTITVYDSLRTKYKEFKIKIFHYVIKETEKWFDVWKKKDKYQLIMPMIHMYHHLEEQKQDNHIDWNNEIDKQKELIKSKILKLDKNAQEFIDNPPRVRINVEARQNIVNVIHKAYWDKFQQSVKDKQWEQLVGFIDEIKDILKNLVPHRLDLHTNMDNNLDSQILKQRLENNMMNETDIFAIMEYIINWIRQFQAPNDDTDTEEWYEHLKTLQNWDVLMRDFFMITFAKLDKIKSVLQTIKNRK